MDVLASWFRRFADVRRSERAFMLRATSLLFLLIAGYTALETARDALVLTRFPPRDIALVYVAVAVGVVPVSAAATRALARFGPTLTLRGALLAGALVLVSLFLSPLGVVALLALYVATALVGTVLVSLFWNLVGAILDVTQGRRLLGLLSAAGVLGGASGSLLAVAAVHVLPVKTILLVAAATMTTACLVVPRAEHSEPLQPIAPASTRQGAANLSGEPFVRRIALLVAVSTVAFLVLDFAFKWTLAQTLAPERIPAFVARYYAALNVLTLVVQAAAGQWVQRASIATTLLVPPTLFVGGALAILAALSSGGTRVAVLVLKGIDGTLRNSLHRVTTELLYLPLSSNARARSKPLIDGALVRTIQGIAGLALFVLASTRDVKGRTLGIALLAAALTWLVTAWSMRAPYLDLLRRSVVGETFLPWAGTTDPLDLESAEALVEFLSHDDPRLVLAAISALVRRGRLRLVPGLILLHGDEGVVTRALSLFAASPRRDWYSLARKRLRDPAEAVRRAAAHALAQHGRLDLSDLADNTSAGARGYAAVHSALQHDDDPVNAPVVAAALGREGPAGDEGRMGMLIAIGLAARDPRLVRLLERLMERPHPSRAWRVEFARAARSQRALFAFPFLVSLLAQRDGRDAVRTAIASFGDDGVRGLRAALSDPLLPRQVRVHLPNTLTRFGTKQAAELALDTLEHDADGLVRYKSLRALGRIVAAHRVKVDRARVERLALKNVLEHLRLLGLRARFDTSPLHVPTVVGEREPTERLLLGMLNDKLRQSLERSFRLLKIARPDEDFHHVHDALLSNNKRVRANATELLDSALRRSRVPRLRELLRVLGEEAAIDEALSRARPLLDEAPPSSREEAIARLAVDRDPMVAALARLHDAARTGGAARVVVGTRAAGPIELAWGETA